MHTKQFLGYLGLIPFALSLYFDEVIELLFQTSALQVFVFYSAIIVSFLAGTLWRKKNDNLSVKLQLISNLFSLSAFFALLTPLPLALIMLALSYIALLLCEYFFTDAEPIIHDYLVMRSQLTLVVVGLHIIAYISWYL